MPALDAHVFEDGAQKLLALLEVERVESGQGSLCESFDACRKPIVLGELRVLICESLAFAVEVAVAGTELGGAAGELGLVDDAGLVEIREAATLTVGSVQPAVEAGKLGGEEVVIGGGRPLGDGDFPGAEQRGLGE